MKNWKVWLSRSTMFAAFFATTAFVLALNGKLTTEYVAMATALHVTVTSRAIAEDYHERQIAASSASLVTTSSATIGGDSASR